MVADGVVEASEAAAEAVAGSRPAELDTKPRLRQEAGLFRVLHVGFVARGCRAVGLHPCLDDVLRSAGPIQEETMLRISLFILALVTLALPVAPRVQAHCQVPCGIYDDQARVDQMNEDVETIRKAMSQMAELAGKSDAQSMNQLVRWITTKEQHASNIITIVSEYFLTQKLAPVTPEAEGHDIYLRKLADHHAVLRAAMKVKQNADPAFADTLHEALHDLARHYAIE